MWFHLEMTSNTSGGNNVLLQDRICKLCEISDKIYREDEYHFLLKCPSYATLRDCYIPQNKGSFQDFISLMSSRNVNIIRNIATYVMNASQRRQTLLDDIIS